MTENPFVTRRPILDDSGNLTGWDTGEESVPATPAEKLAWNSGGGGGGGTSPSPPPTSPSPPPDTKSETQKAREEQKARDLARAEAQYKQEVMANVVRERQAGRVNALGLTQPERDLGISFAREMPVSETTFPLPSSMGNSNQILFGSQIPTPQQKTMRGGTSSNLTPDFRGEVFIPTTTMIREEATGKSFKGVPVTELKVYEPTGTSRTPTFEEEKQFREFKVLTATDVSKWERTKGKTSFALGNINLALKESITQPISELSGATIGKVIGWKGFESYYRGNQRIAQMIEGNSGNILRKAMAGGYEFIGGFGGKGLEFYKEQPLTIATTTAVGIGAGYLVSGATLGASMVGARVGSALGSASLGTAVGKASVTIPVLATSAYFLGTRAGQIGAELELAKTPTDVAGITARESIQLLSFGTGSAYGAKLFQQTAGIFRTLGRKEIPLENLTQKGVITGRKSFPTAPTNQQLKLFQSKVAGKYVDPLGKPGGFHSTPSKFWKNLLNYKEIQGTPGSSELPGTYVSSYISPYFTGVSGSPYSPKITFGLTAGEGLPGVAYLKPESFRISKFVRTKPYQLEGQTFKFAWRSPAKAGVIDLPLMKTEIEGIIRPGTGSYKFESGKYFTKIGGVRIPIDVFGYSGKAPKASGIILKGGSSSYSAPTSSGIKISPEVSLSSFPKKTFSLSRNFRKLSLGLKRGRVRGSSSFPLSSFKSLSSSKGYSAPSTKLLSSSILRSSKRYTGSRVSSRLSKVSYPRYYSPSYPSSSIASSSFGSSNRISSLVYGGKTPKIKIPRRRARGREDLAVLSGFTSSILGLKKTYTPKEIKIKGLKLEAGLGLRPVPVIKK